jgi:hypothetical protein
MMIRMSGFSLNSFNLSPRTAFALSSSSVRPSLKQIQYSRTAVPVADALPWGVKRSQLRNSELELASHALQLSQSSAKAAPPLIESADTVWSVPASGGRRSGTVAVAATVIRFFIEVFQHAVGCDSILMREMKVDARAADGHRPTV